VIRYPTASNLDEFKLLETIADVTWAGGPDDLDDAELVVLPGSKHVAADLEWLRRVGVAAAVAAAARRGRRVLGICGGMQMLGERLVDKAGVDGSGAGLGLLPLQTNFRAAKRAQRVETAFEPLPAPWHELSSRVLRGYEIRHGESHALAPVHEALPGRRGFVAGSVLGITVHGALESPGLVAALLGSTPAYTLDDVFDALADVAEARLDLGYLADLAGV
jgi:adenosylcobyric acid synthase